MNGWWWILRTTSAVCLSPVLAVLGVLVALSNSSFVDPYWLDLSSKATVSLLFLAPGFAALGAWDAARWRSLMPVAVRPWPGLLALHVAVVGAATVVTFMATLAVLSTQVRPAAGAPRWDVLGAGVGMVAAYGAFGFALGRFLPRLLAAPLAFGSVWFWVAYAQAVQPFWIRNVNGNLGTSCCDLGSELAPHALLAPGLIGVALVVGSLLVVLRPHWFATWILAVGLAVVAVIIAAHLVAGFGADPVRPRSGSQACIEARSIELCAWPEHRELLERAGPVLGDAVAHLRRAGLVVPDRLSEKRPVVENWSFVLGRWDPDIWRASLASSILTYLPACGDIGEYSPADEQFGVISAWLASAAGVTADRQRGLSDDDAVRLRRILATDRGHQLAWFDKTFRDLHRCEPVP